MCTILPLPSVYLPNSSNLIINNMALLHNMRYKPMYDKDLNERAFAAILCYNFCSAKPCTFYVTKLIAPFNLN